MVALIKEIPHVYTCITEADRLGYLPKLIAPSWLKLGTELRYPDTILLPCSQNNLFFKKNSCSEYTHDISKLPKTYIKTVIIINLSV